MSAIVDKLQKEFISKIEDRFNEDYYFVETCHPSTIYSRNVELMNISMKIYLLKNSCQSPVQETIQKIQLNDLEIPNIIINNKTVDDKWEKIEW